MELIIKIKEAEADGKCLPIVFFKLLSDGKEITAPDFSESDAKAFDRLSRLAGLMGKCTREFYKCELPDPVEYYLREGDFLPEPVTSAFGTGIKNRPHSRRLLEESGNIFSTREEAKAVSDKVRALLISLSAGKPVESTNTQTATD